MEVNVRWLGCQGPGFHEKGKEWKLCQGRVQIWKKNMKKYTGEQFMCGVTKVVPNAQKTFCCGGKTDWSTFSKDWLQSASVELRGWRGENGCLRRRFVVISTIPLTVQA